MINENYIKLRHFVKEMNETTSILKKKEIIGKYKDNSFITEVLKWTLDPYKTYHVTSKNCKNLSHLIDEVKLGKHKISSSMQKGTKTKAVKVDLKVLVINYSSYDFYSI